MRRDFEQHLKSIGLEFSATKDRVRSLIGDKHWASDGEAKEAVFRRILSAYICESVRVGSGFICHPGPERTYNDNRNTSTQIDVLITHRDRPTLYKAQDLNIVTPDAVEAIVEVKTKIDSAGLHEGLAALANNIQRVRQENSHRKCWAGLFVFEPFDVSGNPAQKVLEILQGVVGGVSSRVINCIALGENLFVRFWEDGRIVSSRMDAHVWHSYELTQLARGYFLGNLVWAVCPSDPAMQYMWFPVENGKESQRRFYCGLTGTVAPF